MQNTQNEQCIKMIPVSLTIKAVIVVWAFVVAVKSAETATSVLYLCLCILFSGLFVFQLSYYRRKKREIADGDEND